MHIRMLKDRNGSNDGMFTITFKQGEEYDVGIGISEILATAWLDAGHCELVEETPPVLFAKPEPIAEPELIVVTHTPTHMNVGSTLPEEKGNPVNEDKMLEPEENKIEYKVESVTVSVEPKVEEIKFEKVNKKKRSGKRKRK